LSKIERRQAWPEKDVGNLRQIFAAQIDDLSKEWEKARGEKEKAAEMSKVASTSAVENEQLKVGSKLSEGSDDEVVITGVSTSKPTFEPKPKPRKPIGTNKRKGKGKAQDNDRDGDNNPIVGREIAKADRLR
jgi:hypothetical protein